MLLWLPGIVPIRPARVPVVAAGPAASGAAGWCSPGVSRRCPWRLLAVTVGSSVTALRYACTRWTINEAARPCGVPGRAGSSRRRPGGRGACLRPRRPGAAAAAHRGAAATADPRARRCAGPERLPGPRPGRPRTAIAEGSRAAAAGSPGPGASVRAGAPAGPSPRPGPAGPQVRPACASNRRCDSGGRAARVPARQTAALTSSGVQRSRLRRRELQG